MLFFLTLFLMYICLTSHLMLPLNLLCYVILGLVISFAYTLSLPIAST